MLLPGALTPHMLINGHIKECIKAHAPTLTTWVNILPQIDTQSWLSLIIRKSAHCVNNVSCLNKCVFSTPCFKSWKFFFHPHAKTTTVVDRQILEAVGVCLLVSSHSPNKGQRWGWARSFLHLSCVKHLRTLVITIMCHDFSTIILLRAGCLVCQQSSQHEKGS